MRPASGVALRWQGVGGSGRINGMNWVWQVMRLGALCAVAHHGGAWAINQCVGPDGKVSFQDAPCAPDQTSKEINPTPSSKGIKPTQGSAPRPAQRPAAPGKAASAQAPAAKPERPADCPSPEEMQKLQLQLDALKAQHDVALGRVMVEAAKKQQI